MATSQLIFGGSAARYATPMPGHTKVLNPKQIAFAQAVVFGINGQPATITEAAKHAGYHDTTRHTPGRLAKTPIVKAEIERLRALARANMLMDAETWQRELLYQYQTVRDDDHNAALRALDAWAKRLGLYESGDNANSDKAALLTAHLVALAALQLANSPAVTVEAPMRRALGAGEHTSLGGGVRLGSGAGGD